MDWTRCHKLMWRWSLLTAALIAAFWGVWSFFAPVPFVDIIQINKDYSLATAFPMSRWWDVLIGPIGSIMIIGGACYVMRYSLVRDLDLVIGLVSWLAFVLVYGLTFGLVYGLVVGLVFGLVVEPVLGLASGQDYGLVIQLIVGLASGLVVGLIVGLVHGIAFGLIVGLVYGLAFGLIPGLAILIKNIVSRNFWVAVGNWLTAKN